MLWLKLIHISKRCHKPVAGAVLINWVVIRRFTLICTEQLIWLPCLEKCCLATYDLIDIFLRERMFVRSLNGLLLDIVPFVLQKNNTQIQYG